MSLPFNPRSQAGFQSGSQSGQAALLLLGVLAAVLAGVLMLFGFGQALGARGHAQRAADLAAVSAAQVMRRNLTRLFEPALLEGGVPNPRHLSSAEYLSLARGAALRGARANGVEPGRVLVRFPRAGFAPTRVTVAMRRAAEVSALRQATRADSRSCAAPPPRSPSTQRASAWPRRPAAAATPARSRTGRASRCGPTSPRRSTGWRRPPSARPGLALLVTSGYRSDAEQARLFAAHPDPKWVAPPGTSLHRFGTELDLGPPPAYGWLDAQRRRFGFVKQVRLGALALRLRANAGSASVGFGGGAERRGGGLPPFVPAAYREPTREGRAALERRRRAAGGAALRRVGLRPARPQPGRGGGHRPVHARARRPRSA